MQTVRPIRLKAVRALLCGNLFEGGRFPLSHSHPLSLFSLSNVFFAAHGRFLFYLDMVSRVQFYFPPGAFYINKMIEAQLFMPLWAVAKYLCLRGESDAFPSHLRTQRAWKAAGCRWEIKSRQLDNDVGRVGLWTQRPNCKLCFSTVPALSKAVWDFPEKHFGQYRLVFPTDELAGRMTWCRSSGSWELLSASLEQSLACRYDTGYLVWVRKNIYLYKTIYLACKWTIITNY